MSELDNYHTKLRKKREKKEKFVDKAKPLIEESLDMIVALNSNPDLRQFEKKVMRKVSKLDNKSKRYLSKAGVDEEYTDVLLYAKELYGMMGKLISADELMEKTQEYIQDHGAMCTYLSISSDWFETTFENRGYATYRFAKD